LAVTALEVFDFLDRHASGSLQKHEIHSALFGTLRRSIRTIVTRLNEGGEDDSRWVADSLRVLLSELLTVPICFDGALLESVSALGEAEAVEARWGREIRLAYDLACTSAIEIQKEENPARTLIRNIVKQLRMQGQDFRVYCHSRARVHFESIFQDQPLVTESFLHSVRDYREVKPFDVLIKMGPLRSAGWGSAPDAILNAPRFETLVQIVWPSCADEDNFGYDPAACVGKEVALRVTGVEAQDRDHRSITWTRSLTHFGDPSSDSTAGPDIDELKYFHELTRVSELRHATLVQIDEENGILYPPHSKVATLDPEASAEEAISYRLPGETLTEGMFVIWPRIAPADLGILNAGEGHYSRIWKERLSEQFRHASRDLLLQLRESGIELRNLYSCVLHWCRPASTVIHAPQQRKHFEILISVLGIDHGASASVRTLRRPWWEYAWNEIGRSRGEAIQTGMQEHEIIDEELFLILNDLLPDILRGARTQKSFQIDIPDGRPLKGAVLFCRVRSVEEGFRVPDTNLKVICDLDTVEQWRV
jgi:hypothetical protein